MHATPADGERADLLESLATARYFLRKSTDDITDDQARQQTTVSALTLGGLIKHVMGTEAAWARFAVEGEAAFGEPVTEFTEAHWAARQAEFTLLPDETLAGVLAEYEQIAVATDEVVRTVDLDLAHPLPAAPWFEPGKTQTARRTFHHVVAETAQHAGHADIIREALDGVKSMG